MSLSSLIGSEYGATSEVGQCTVMIEVGYQRGGADEIRKEAQVVKMLDLPE